MNSLPPTPPHDLLPIFLADDDVLARSKIAAKLRADGFQLVELESGRELSDRLSGEPTRLPRVVIAAMFLPGVSGLELCANIKDSGLPIRVILTTPTLSDELLEEAKRAGAHAVLECPLDQAKLSVLVSEALLAESE